MGTAFGIGGLVESGAHGGPFWLSVLGDELVQIRPVPLRIIAKLRLTNA
jgi:hypothetical protein